MNDGQIVLLRNGLKSLELENIGIDPASLIPLFVRYFEELLLWNPRLGLLEAGKNEIITKHFLDSAAAVGVFDAEMGTFVRNGDRRIRMADIGSGGGFPGVVLALLLSRKYDLRVSLIEKQKRRCGFLLNIVPLLGLRSCVEVVQSDISLVGDRYHIITSRAFAAISLEQLALQRSLLLAGGKIIAYKGRREVLEKEPGCAKGSVLPLDVPGLNAERHLVILGDSQ